MIGFASIGRGIFDIVRKILPSLSVGNFDLLLNLSMIFVLLERMVYRRGTGGRFVHFQEGKGMYREQGEMCTVTKIEEGMSIVLSVLMIGMVDMQFLMISLLLRPESELPFFRGRSGSLRPFTASSPPISKISKIFALKTITAESGQNFHQMPDLMSISCSPKGKKERKKIKKINTH